MEDLEKIKKEINLIIERNKRVEINKAWETSKTRILSILVMTYIITAVVFYFIGVKSFILSALIPSVGFYLSTLSLPFIKKTWVSNLLKNNKNKVGLVIEDKKPICPFCGNDNVRPIVYGLREFKSIEDEKEFEKTHMLGGCVIDENSPAYYCDYCKKGFGKLQPIEE